MAEVVVNNITGRKDHMRYNSMPAVVYTSPEVAVVRLTKEEAEERGIKVKVGRIPMAINARYIAENPNETGFCKVVLEADTRKLLGVHMVGGACSEMILEQLRCLKQNFVRKRLKKLSSLIPPLQKSLRMSSWPSDNYSNFNP